VKKFLVLLVCVLSVVPHTIFASTNFQEQSLKYIYSFQDKSGGLKEDLIDGPQSLQTDWAIIAGSSSGYDSSTVGSPASLIDYANSDACQLESVTDIERRVIALSSAGINTAELSSCDLPAKIIASTDPNTGKIGGNLVSTVFGAIALSSEGKIISDQTIGYIISAQNANGGWDSGFGTESNITAQTLMALAGSGYNIHSDVIDKAKLYLKSLQTPNGGIKYDQNPWSSQSDAFSDSFTLQAIYALKENPLDEFWQTCDKTIIDDLSSLQNADGSYNFNLTYGKMSPVWTTSIALIAQNHDFLPISERPLAKWAMDSPEPSVSASATPSVSSSSVEVSSTATPNVTASVLSRSIMPSSTATYDFVADPVIRATATATTTESSIAPTAKSIITDDKNPQNILGETITRVKSNWQWAVILVIFSIFTGIMVKFIEIKYGKKIN
jgi:hypothetical protein